MKTCWGGLINGWQFPAIAKGDHEIRGNNRKNAKKENAV